MSAAHCNGRKCVESSAYGSGNSRACACTCDGCASEDAEQEAPPAEGRVAPHASAKQARRVQISTPWGVMIGATLVLTYLIVTQTRACDGDRASTAISQAPKSPAPKEENAVAYAPSPPRTPAAAAKTEPEADTLATAIARIRPIMSDTSGGVVSDGARGLAATMLEQMPPWAELMAVPSTDPKRLMKEPNAERGKRICVSGSIIEIEVGHEDGASFADGGMVTDGGDTVRFAAVGSTGDFVKDSYARFCGIATGKFSYVTVTNETRHAVFVVGMFDLPKNHVATPTAAAANPAANAPVKAAPSKPRCHPCDPGHCPDPRDAPNCEW